MDLKAIWETSVIERTRQKEVIHECEIAGTSCLSRLSGGGLHWEEDIGNCGHCRRSFQPTDGILTMLPSTPHPDSRLSDPDYRKWSEIRAYELENYFEKGNAVYSVIHHSSHKVANSFLNDSSEAGITLDLGCGVGAHFPYYGDLGKVIGIDIDRKGLLSIKSKYPDSFLIEGDIYSLPVGTASIEQIISIYILEHIYHLRLALEEVCRVLKDDGRLAVGLPCEGGLAWNGGRRLTSERHISKKYGIDYSRAVKIEHCNDISFVRHALEDLFVTLRHTRFPFPFIPLDGVNLTYTGLFKKRP